MHKILDEDFTLDSFSISNLIYFDYDNEGHNMLEDVIACLNYLGDEFIKTKDKKYWQAMIELLPSSYNQKRTVTMTYENVLNMYHARKNHKLSEWHELCNWAEDELDYFKEMCLDKEKNNGY